MRSSKLLHAPILTPQGPSTMKPSRLLLCLTLVLSASYSTYTFAQSNGAKPQNPEKEKPEKEKPAPGYFPVCAQLSPLPSGKGWKSGSGPLDKQTLRDSIDNIRKHGFTGLEMRIDLPKADLDYVRKYALEQGMFLVAHAGAIEGFDRNRPPSPSVYSPDYAKSVRARAESALASTKNQKGLRYVFTFQDEPFHAGPRSFGHGKFEKEEFKRRYGYDLPDDPQTVRDDPQRWLDVINFHSDNYPDGWRQTCKAVKAVNPNFTTILTHDSHNTFGGGCGSHSVLAIDDIFHWGGDFSDMFVFDIYPYMSLDFRFGRPGLRMKPRMSQTHYSFAQMRNLTRAHGKQLGFWVGTYNPAWFKDVMGHERRSTYWSEREMSTTAVAAGADFLLTGLKLPVDAEHWESFGQGLRLIQKAGARLLDAPRVKAKACMIFPRTQYIQLQQEYFNVALSYELFLRAFGELDILHEEQVVDDRLDGYDIVVLFDVKLLPKQVARRIASFAAKGGTVIADCLPVMDELRRPIDTMEKLFGVEDAQTGRITRTGHWVERVAVPSYWFNRPPESPDELPTNRDSIIGTALGRGFNIKTVSTRSCTPSGAEVLLKTVADKPALLRRKVGKGQVFLLGFCVQDTYFQMWEDKDAAGRAELRGLISAITASCGLRSHVWSSNPAVEAAVRANPREGFLFIINHETERPAATIRIADLLFPIAKIIDLADGKPVEFSYQDGVVEIATAVALGETRLLHLQAKP